MLQAFTIIAVFFLSLGLARAETSDQEVKRLVAESTAAVSAGHDDEAVRTCAAALKLSSSDPAAQACAKALDTKVPAVVKSGAALLGVGDFERALERCGAALVLNSTDTAAQTCVSSAHSQMAAQRRDQLKLEQAHGFSAAGDATHAQPLLDELSKSTFPDILQAAAQLQTVVNRKAVEQADTKQRAAIRKAQFQIADGKRDQAATTLQDVIASNPSPAVVKDAVELLSSSMTSWRTTFLEGLRSPWIVQVLAALVIVGGLWIGLHWARNAWRWVDCQFLQRWRQRSWKFAGVSGEDTHGARDPILDALGRVPNEIRKSVWTPTRLLLYPAASGWEVWENFGVGSAPPAKPVHEDVFQVRWDVGGDKALAEAFQNLQFNVGTVGVNAVVKFWTSLVEWWRTGEPAFSATCQEIDTADGAGKQVVIRLNASGPGGTVSVLASTPRGESVDAVSLAAERAAYKLLFRMKKNQDTAAQIDGHAAYRQGVAAVSCCVRSVVDAQTDKDRRNAAVVKAIQNLEFARQTFNRDLNHRVYHLESLRFLAIAYALIGRDAAARQVFEELEDATTGSSAVRDQQLEIEAQYNQAILYWKSLFAAGGQSRAASSMSETMFDNVARDPTLAAAAHVWQLAQLGNLSRRGWLSLNKDNTRCTLEKAATLAKELDAVAAKASGSERRHYALLAGHARRHLAIAQLGFVAAFDLPARGPFAGNGNHVTPEILSLVQSAFDCLRKSEQIGPLSTTALAARAYGLLLLSKWLDAEEAAGEVISTDKADQFALYVAAEAALQRKDLVSARKYAQDVTPIQIVDPALRDLIAQLPAA